MKKLLSLVLLIPTLAFAGTAKIQVDTKTHAVSIEDGSNVIDAKNVTLTLGGFTISDAGGMKTVVTGATSGAVFGATGNKIAFLGATAVVRQTGNIFTALTAYGLVNSPTLTIANVTSLQTTLDAKALAATTVNGHALTGNVNVTKGDVGLGSADNTSDASKPVSTAQQTAIDLKTDKTTTVNGHALSGSVTVSKGDVGLGNADNTSDANKPVSTAQATADTTVASNAAAALSTHTGNTSNPHSVTKTQVGLGNADNTSDAAKPVSTAQQTALDLKANNAAVAHNTGAENIAGPKSFTDPLNFYSLTGNSVVSTVLATPGAPTVTPIGTHGASTWTYKIVAKLSDGTVTAVGPAGSTAVGDDVLDSTNKNSLAWTAVTGAATYDVYRTVVGVSPTTTGKIANVSTNAYIDAGAAGDSSTPPSFNTTGRVTGAIVDNGGQVFNVKAGANPAIGDGVTDDTAAIQARIDAAGLVAGCVFFPASNYRTTTLNVTGNVRLTGVDASTTGSTLSTVSNATLLNITAKCTVENLAFSGSINLNPTYTLQDLIVVTDTNDVYLRNLFVSHGYNNIRYQGTCFYQTLNQVRFYESKNAELRTAGSSSSGHQIQMNGCSVTGGSIRTNYVFLLDNVGSMMINGLLLNHSNTVNGGIIANTAANPGFGGFRITGSDIELEGGNGNGPALAIVGTSGFAFRNVQVSNSYFGAANAAADRVIDLSYIYQSEFTNCIFTGPNRGVKFLKAIDNMTFSNCSFQTGDIPVISDGEQGTAHIDGVVFQGCHYTGPGAMFFLHPISAGNITVRDSAIGRSGPTIDIPAYNSGKTVRFSNCWGGDGTSNPQPYSQGPLTAPGVPASNNALQNPFLVPVTIYVSPGFANSFINNVSTGSSNTRIDLEPGQIVTLSYGSPITWTWFGH